MSSFPQDWSLNMVSLKAGPLTKLQKIGMEPENNSMKNKLGAVGERVSRIGEWIRFEGVYLFGLGVQSLLYLLMAPFAKPRRRNTVTSGMQMGKSLSEKESSTIEEHFPRRGETMSYDLALLILWMVLSAIIQVYWMKYMSKMLERQKAKAARTKLAVKVCTLKPLNNMLMEQKKSEKSPDFLNEP